MSCAAFCSPVLVRHRRLAWQPGTAARRGLRASGISMSKKTPKRARRDSGKGQPGPAPPKQSGDSAPVPDSAEEMLRKDLEVIRSKRGRIKPKEDKPAPLPLDAVKSAIDAILLWDFFLVVGLLGWLAVALIPHFASKNDVLLDPWLGLWQPFIQPVLGVLMLGTIVQGTISFINSKD